MQRHRSRKGTPGIVEVAARAGVSPATVSRFYNDPEIVRVETRQRIMEAAAHLGYIRDRLAGGLHNRASGTMGLVVPTISNTIFSQLIEAFSSRLQLHDRTMLIASNNYNEALEVSIIQSLLERRIDGVALIGHEHAPEALDMLSVRDVPVVTLWSYREASALPCVGADHAAAANKVTTHLLEQGHRDITFIFPDLTLNDRASDRLRGARAAMSRYGLSIPDNRLIRCPYDVTRAKAVAESLFLSPSFSTRVPTAVVCGNDVIAHGVMYAAHRHKLRIPDDISVVGIGDFPGSADIEPGLTTVRLPARRIGEAAADMLIAMSQADTEHVPVSLCLETALVNRQSTRAHSMPGAPKSANTASAESALLKSTT